MFKEGECEQTAQGQRTLPRTLTELGPCRGGLTRPRCSVTKLHSFHTPTPQTQKAVTHVTSSAGSERPATVQLWGPSPASAGATALGRMEVTARPPCMAPGTAGASPTQEGLERKCLYSSTLHTRVPDGFWNSSEKKAFSSETRLLISKPQNSFS